MRVKPLKQALVIELNSALAALLPVAPTGVPPKGVTQAVEELADSILRWRASQHRSAHRPTSKSSSSESDALARLMDGQLHEEDAPAQPTAILPPAALSDNPPHHPPAERKRRPRIAR